MVQDDLKEFTIKNLFESEDKYVIPIYQRNYAWSEVEITQLIQDVYDFATDKSYHKKNYYIGTLVVYKQYDKNKWVFETIDGQQRLTALNIILSAIKNEVKNFFKYFPQNEINIEKWYKEVNLEFAIREKSTKTLLALFEKDEMYINENHNEISQSYHDSVKYMKNLFKNKEDAKKFYDFLSNYVVILRVEVPEDTDLNHYFEIMNTRGEQLEKHEILKSSLIKILNDSKDEKLSRTFNIIWNSCFNMDRYVQYEFKKEFRNDLFGPNWNKFKPNNFDDIVNILFPKNTKLRDGTDGSSDGTNDPSLLDIIESGHNDNHFTEEDSIDFDNSLRFNSIINFSNFILHILRIKINEKKGFGVENDVSLDDKILLATFSKYLDNEDDKIEFVKDLGFNILKSKFLFDKYILKREYKGDKDKWSLKKLIFDNNRDYYKNTYEDKDLNDNIILLLSMFHVSYPTLTYKHWLNATLKFLLEEDKIEPHNYIKFLEELAVSFLFNRYLKEGKPIDFYDIIYKNHSQQVETETIYKNLDNGVFVENFIFNHLDYLIWKRDHETNGNINRFEFTFRSSVEHFYPRKPRGSIPVLDNDCLDKFGNLCLISASRNSQFTSKTPEAKRIHFKDNSLKIESLKQDLMFKIQEKEDWGEEQIKNHGKEMKELIKKSNKNCFDGLKIDLELITNKKNIYSTPPRSIKDNNLYEAYKHIVHTLHNPNSKEKTIKRWLLDDYKRYRSKKHDEIRQNIKECVIKLFNLYNND